MPRRSGPGQVGAPGRGCKAVPAEYVEEVLRRIFVYQFMCPDDFAWAPIDILGVEYD